VHIQEHANKYKVQAQEQYQARAHVQIEAQVAGFKRKAKIQGKDIEEVMREFFNRRKQTYNLKQSTIDKIVARLMDEYVK
jgi:hypothetical protein